MSEASEKKAMSLCREGVVSFWVFLVALVGIILCYTISPFVDLALSSPLFVLALCCLWFLCLPTNELLVAKPAFILGVSVGFGLIIAFSGLSWSLSGWYIAALAFFHWSEYFFTALTNPQNLNLDSYLLNHSLEYHLAILASFIEYALEWIYFPALSEPNLASVIGLALVVFGEVFRKGAMWNAGTNFNHHIRSRREHDHELVTTGFYSWCRHPSYVGWFFWSVGTQIMVCNPVCAVLYTIFSWSFFRERIATEEYTLYRFFGADYQEYQKKVPTGLPFIYGYNPAAQP